MIQRIINIQNFHTFKNFTWGSNLENFNKYNLIYGWNGCGKTTLSNLFRQVEIKKIHEDCGIFKFETTNGMITGDNLESTDIKIKVFNNDFIKESIFTPTGDVHPIFTIGQEDIKKRKNIEILSKKLEQLKKDSKEQNGKCNVAKTTFENFKRDKAREIKESLRSSDSKEYANYDKSNFGLKCEELKETNYKDKILNLQELEQLRKSILDTPKEKLEYINTNTTDLNKLTIEIKGILETSITSKTIERLSKDSKLNSWVETGFYLHKEKLFKKCLFCGSKLPENCIEKLDSHFSDEYSKLKENLKNLEAKINTEYWINLRLHDSARLYSELILEYNKEILLLEKETKLYNEYLNELSENINKKLDNPYELVTIPKKNPDISILKILENVNSIINKHNDKTDEFSKEKLKNKKKIEEHYVAKNIVEYLKNYNDSETAKKILNQKKLEIQKKSEEIEQIKSEISGHAKSAESINKDLERYLGHDNIKLKADQKGYKITINDKIANSLSEGEKTAISFIYFLRSLKDRDFDKNNGVVVIDDPISSLDSNSLFCAFGFLKDNTENLGQLFILTHNYTFFRETKNWLKNKNKINYKKPSSSVTKSNFYMLSVEKSQEQRMSVLKPLDKLLLTYDSEYHYLFNTLYKNRNKKSEELEDYYHLPNLSRRFLESFLAFRIPTTGDLTSKFETLRLEPEINNATKIRIIQFIHTHSHKGFIENGPEHDSSTLSETPDIINYILKIVEIEDPNHYNKMVESIEKVKK